MRGVVGADAVLSSSRRPWREGPFSRPGGLTHRAAFFAPWCGGVYARRVNIDILIGDWERFEPLEGQGFHFALLDAADLWRERGHGVRVVRGLADLPQGGRGEVCVLHVDLTRTPPAYLERARSYPVAVNARFVDNAKRVVSRDLVTPGDGYEGAVIVKSDLNYGGSPERVLDRRTSGWLARRGASLRRRLPWMLRSEIDPKDYRVFERRAEVPRAVWWNRHLVVERFFTERAEGMYWLRSWVFLGDRGFVRYCGSVHPVIKAERVKIRRMEDDTDPVHLPDSVRVRRAELGMDYGKIDFIVEDGVAHVIDANRTPNSRAKTPEARRAEAVRVAEGLDALVATASQRILLEKEFLY